MVEKELGLGGEGWGDAAVEGGVHECIQDRDFARLGLIMNKWGGRLADWYARSLAWAEELVILILRCIHQEEEETVLVDNFILMKYFILLTRKKTAIPRP